MVEKSSIAFRTQVQVCGSPGEKIGRDTLTQLESGFGGVVFVSEKPTRTSRVRNQVSSFSHRYPWRRRYHTVKRKPLGFSLCRRSPAECTQYRPDISRSPYDSVRDDAVSQLRGRMWRCRQAGEAEQNFRETIQRSLALPAITSTATQVHSQVYVSRCAGVPEKPSRMSRILHSLSTSRVTVKSSYGLENVYLMARAPENLLNIPTICSTFSDEKPPTRPPETSRPRMMMSCKAKKLSHTPALRFIFSASAKSVGDQRNGCEACKVETTVVYATAQDSYDKSSKPVRRRSKYAGLYDAKAMHFRQPSEATMSKTTIHQSVNSSCAQPTVVTQMRICKPTKFAAGTHSKCLGFDMGMTVHIGTMPLSRQPSLRRTCCSIQHAKLLHLWLSLRSAARPYRWANSAGMSHMLKQTPTLQYIDKEGSMLSFSE